MAELAAAPRVNQAPGSLHRVPQRFCRPDEILCGVGLNVQYGTHLRDDLMQVTGWQITKRFPFHDRTLCRGLSGRPAGQALRRCCSRHGARP